MSGRSDIDISSDVWHIFDRLPNGLVQVPRNRLKIGQTSARRADIAPNTGTSSMSGKTYLGRLRRELVFDIYVASSAACSEMYCSGFRVLSNSAMLGVAPGSSTSYV